MTIDVAFDAEPPGWLTPPALGPSKPNNDASFLPVTFSITVSAGDTR
jgi:hypothetical protein